MHFLARIGQGLSDTSGSLLLETVNESMQMMKNKASKPFNWMNDEEIQTCLEMAKYSECQSGKVIVRQGDKV